MGLPMFREPEEVESKTVTKIDPTASARSSIRRHRSVRYPPHLNRDRYLSSRSRSRRHHEAPVEANGAHEAFRVVGARSHAEHAYDIEQSANYAHAEASRQRRHESGRAMLRDALSYERAHRSIDLRREHSYALSMMRPPTPPTSSSRNLSRLQRQIPPDSHRRLERRNSRNRTGLSRTPPPAYIPSPPYTSGEQSDRSSPDGLRSAQGTASLTPRFAPAHPLGAWEPPAGQAPPQIDPPPHDDVTAADSTDELPPLRRVSRRHDMSRSYQDFPHSVVDGLGDRWRSVSPDDAFWENLVSTMPPDARLPSTSASSSFRSNEASSHYDTVNSGRAIAERIDSYPYVCENTDSEFSEVDEDAVRTLQRLGDESYSLAPRDFVEDSAATWQRRMHAPNNLSSQSAHQRRALSNGGGMDLNNVLSTRPQRQQTDEWFRHNQRGEFGRPSRERL